MSQHLGVEVVDFKGRVMDMELWALEEEETVVVYEFLALCQSIEGNYVLPVWGMANLVNSSTQVWSGDFLEDLTSLGTKLK